MNVLKHFILGGTLIFTPITLLAAPTVYIPLGSANEILIVDGATDKKIGKITGFKNIHGLSLTPNGEYLIAGSNAEIIANSSKMAGHGTIPKKSPKTKPATSSMKKPAGVSEAEHKKHHPQEKVTLKKQPQSIMKGKTNPANSNSKKNKGMSDAKHKKHHSAQSGGLLPPVGLSSISLIRVADNKIESKIKVRGMAHHTFVTPNGKYAVSTHTTAGKITLIDLASKKIFRNIYTGPQPNYVVFAKDGEQMYVSNSGNNTLSVIDTKNWIVSRNILVGKGPEHIVISPDEKFIYSNNARDGTITKVSLANLKVIKTYTIGNNPHGIDISADGTTLYASTKKDNKLIAVNTKTGKVKTLTLSPAPYHVSVIGNTGKLYVSSREKPLIWVIDAKKLKVIGKIKIKGEGHQFVVTL